MELIAGTLIIAASFLVSFVYLRFARLDHRFPAKSPGILSLAVNSVLLALLTLSSGGSLQTNPELASSIAMLALGLMAAPAIAPPIYLDPSTFPSKVGRWLEGLKGRISAIAAHKVIAGVVAVAAIWWPGKWYWIAGCICMLLLWAKGAALAGSESGGEAVVIHPTALKRWSLRALGACLCFALLWSAGPYLVFSESQFVPSAWTAFAGIGLGMLFTGFE